MYQSFEPAPALAPFVECYWRWIVEGSSQPVDDILPDAAPELIVHLAGRPLAQTDDGGWQEQPQAFLYCAARKPLRLRVVAPLDVVAVRFRPWGVGRFCNTPMASLLDRPIVPSEAFPGFGDDLAAALSSAASDEARTDAGNAVLLAALESNTNADPRLAKLLQAAGGGRCSAAEMAQQLSISGRTFSRLWHDVVGIQPREFVKLMRFHSALEKIDQGLPLTEVAAACGYSDQAHMARQIKSIAGLPATALRNRLGREAYRNLYSSRPDAPWKTVHPA